MKIGRKMLTLAAMAALSVGAVFAQGTAPKPAKASNQPMASKMAEDHQTTSSQPSKKKAGKHGHHHNNNKKHASNTPTPDATTKK
jgi:Spy/CpxP family protein refolding chaperone